MGQLLLFLFCISLSLIFTHELDAMIQQEWRLLPFLSGMQNETARIYFTLLHIPLFLLILYFGFSNSDKIRATTRRLLSVGLLVHGLAHFFLRNSEQYLFTPPIETITVYGAAITAVIYLIVDQMSEKRSTDQKFH